MATFNERLKELRNKQNLTQKELAAAVGVDKNTVSVWERGLRSPNDEYVIPLVNVPDTTITYLFGVSDSDDIPVLSDEEAAAVVAAEEQELMDHMINMFRELSPESQRTVKVLIGTLWTSDRDKGRLQKT